jgi:hypothetical protein
MGKRLLVVAPSGHDSIGLALPVMAGQTSVMAPDLVGLALWPVRLARRAIENEVTTPLEDTENQVLEGVKAIHRASDSIEHHVEVIETLATSVKPLTDSVDAHNATMRDLVGILGPLAAAEHGLAHADEGVVKAERFFGFHRHKPASAGRSDQTTEPTPDR